MAHPSHDGPCELNGCDGTCRGGIHEDDAPYVCPGCYCVGDEPHAADCIDVCESCGREYPCECPDPCNMCGALDCYGECDRNEDGG